MPAQKTLYIHIGMPKTGTTTIQHGLQINEDALRENGYYLPVTGRLRSPRTIVHANVGLQYLTDNAAFHDRYDDSMPFSALIDEIQQQDAPNSIISHEILFSMPPEQNTAFRAAIPANIRPVIIIYIRRHDRYVQSAWSQHVRISRKTWSFEEYFDRLDDPKQQRYRDYDFILSGWEREFGIENIRVRRFDEVIAGETHLFHDFLQTCDVPQPPQYAVPEQINISPSYKTLEVIRAVTKRANLDTNDPDSFFDITRFTEPVQKYAQQAGWDSEKLNLMTPERHRRIQQLFGESDARVARRYFDSDTLFPHSYKDRPVSQFDMERDVTPDDWLSIATFAMLEALKRSQNANRLLKRNEQLQRQLTQTRLQAELDAANKRIADLEAELANRRQLPLARAGELIAAAQREAREGGMGGLFGRVWGWLQGQRSGGQHSTR
ncbi:MAG: hypothetical protein AAFV33_02280 [Chloroflexota bacterium]